MHSSHCRSGALLCGLLAASALAEPAATPSPAEQPCAAVEPSSASNERQHAAKPQARETLTSDITLDPGARVSSVESMTGSITLSRGARVSGNVSSDYGAVVLEPESEVVGRLSSDAGSITIDGARVGRGISTTSGDINIGADSQIQGGILVRKRGVIGLSLGFFQLGVPAGRSTPPRVVIGPGATVSGQLRFKREVQLFVSERASIGPVEGATPIIFTGERPPG
jgi:cytoskeletal protein CcmA (bactofilin family)